MRKENTGRRERGSRAKDDRTPAKRKSTQKPLQRYAVADKREPGWTKPDGKPLRKRAGKKDDTKSFERKRPSREIGTGRGKETDFKEGRSDFSSARGKRDFSDKPERSEKPFRKPAGDFKKDFSSPRGKSDFSSSRSRADKPFRSEGDDFKNKARREERPSRSELDDFKTSRRSDDKPFAKRDDFKTSRRRDDKPFAKKDDFKKEGDFKTGRKDFSSERGKGDFKTSRSREDKPFSERDDFKKDGDFKTGRKDFSAERGKSAFSARSRDEKPIRRRSDDEKPERREYSSARGKKERPPRGKSFLKSSVPDDKPFERFEKDFSREERRTDKFKLRAKPSRSRSNDNDGPSEKTTSADGTIRLNRYIANAGICSRREADEFISAGLVTVNGEIISEVGTKVLPTDDVRYNGERLKAEKNVYVLLNKPKDYITTSEDPDGRKTVMELIAKACKERVYPVGRLDRNTTGVLLFTNDGDLAKKLTHPSSNIKKVYHVELDKSLKKNDMQMMLDGMDLEDGRSAVDDISYDAGGDKKQVGVELHSGKNRIVRRMFEQLGYEVRKLDRVVFAGLTKKDLPRGRWRLLAETEVGILKMQVGKASKKGDKGEKSKSQLKLF